ncbi:hypothetical protein GOP47_0016882 [Adiantum capillus-veneris]|uniref:Uncharacterized protein n=1 Tax=Adiantum capillus-veneris TaxID=13818 RepID=A0A9D4UIW6_ADICA|nr:hypothetical protein GOP47_0016882 [Adiantum capillus-veneris]
MKLVAGSYERYLWGWRVEKKKGQLQPVFSYPAHLAPIKCIASWGSVLATGGADDTIKIFDTNTNTDMGTLTHHTGAVTALSFYGSAWYPSNLLSASDDGLVCLWDTNSWLLYKSMKGHRNGVSDLSIHPSGRLCLSVGRDSHLNMYDLIKGRRSFTSKLFSEASLVRFSPLNGSTYALAIEGSVVIHRSDDGRPLHTFAHEKRVLCMAQEEDVLLFTGGEDRTIRAWDTRTAELAFAVMNAHTNRVRGLCVWAVDKASETVAYKVASASSDGSVRVWDTRLIKNGDDSSPVMEAETKARLTCLVACSVKKSMVESRKDNDNMDAVYASVTDDITPASTQTIRLGGETTKRDCVSGASAAHLMVLSWCTSIR